MVLHRNPITMRNLIYILLILLTATTATAQSPTRGGGNNQLQSWYGGFKVIRYLAPPNTFNPWATYDSLGMVWIDSTTTKKLMWHTGVYRRYVASERYVDSLFATAVTGVTQQTLDDTAAAIRADITSGSTDSSLYSTKAYRQKGIDSVNGTVATRVKYTDTAAMLLPYQRTVNATSGTVTSVATGYGASGGTITTSGTISADTAAIATRSRVQKAVDSLNVSIGTKGSGTVTNVATNNGTGITGGAITGTGTIAADTTILGTRLWRDKLADSLNVTIAARVKYTDTASMLLPYQRTVNATSGTVTSVATGYGVSGGTITSSGTVVVDTATLFSKYTTTLGAGTGISITGRTISATSGSGTVTNVIGGTNISITGTSTIQPTVNITGQIAVANGGTGTTSTTSVNTTPITYGSNNTVTVPIATGVTGLGTGVATWAATPSSANLASAITDETGSGAAVFATKPTFVGTIHTPSAVAASAFDGSAGNYFTRTLTSSQTFTQSNFSTGQNFIVVLTQGSGTTYNPTWWIGITWVTSGGTAPTMTTTSNGITTYGFTCTGTNTFLGYLIGSQ